jgi:transcriptional regulator with XRE-family HTH domain
MTARAERIGAMGRAEPSGFGELLRRYRTAARLTQEELAERAGLSARGVSDLERGIRRIPHSDTTRRLAEALGLGDAERTELLGAVDRAGSSGRSAQVARPTPTPPMSLTSFVGRQAELAEGHRLLSSARLLTLTGTGGWARPAWRSNSSDGLLAITRMGRASWRWRR